MAEILPSNNAPKTLLSSAFVMFINVFINFTSRLWYDNRYNK